MSYTLIDIELTQPLPVIALDKEQNGVGLIIRWNGRPIGFVMQPLPPSTVLPQKELIRILCHHVGGRALQELLSADVVPHVDYGNFPSLTVAVCTKDRPEYLARCLAALLKVREQSAGWQSTRAESPTPVAFEILVVDNAPSDDRTKCLVATMPEVRYVLEPKPGLDFARNQAIYAASGDLIAFVDDDAIVDSQWLCGLMEAWAENKDAAAFTGLVLPYELKHEAQILFEKRGGFRRGFDKIRYGPTLPGNPFYPCAPVFGTGCNMAFRRDVLIELGGFDEALDTGKPVPGGGDLDIFYRIIRAGYTLIYEPKYLVFHEHRRDLPGLRRQYWSWGLGLLAFLSKTYSWDSSQRVRIICTIVWYFQYLVRHLVWSLLGRHFLSPDMLLAEIWGGIVGLMGEYSRSVKRIEQIKVAYGSDGA